MPTGRCARALTQGDIASWIVAGEYTTRAPARHRYDVGLSYSTQRYDGGNFAALARRHRRQPQRRRALRVRHLRDLADPDADLRRPLRALRLPRRRQPDQPARRADATSRRSTSASARCCRAARVAPGAEEFMPRVDSGIWLPPQRTFSSIRARSCRSRPSAPITSRSRSSATSRRRRVSLRAFRQHVADQIVTLFGVERAGCDRRPSATISSATSAMRTRSD